MNNMIPNVNIPEGISGRYKIEKKYIKPSKIDDFRLSMSGRHVPEGEYTFLYRDNTLVMSDTPDEKRDHYYAVRNAKGKCLIAGLGIGMVLNAIALKEEVTSIDVVESSQDVINLVSGYYNNKFPNKINFICCSIFDFTPNKNIYYDMAWFDIWDDLCTDNLKQMSLLHRKFGRKAECKGSWGKEFLQHKKKQRR